MNNQFSDLIRSIQSERKEAEFEKCALEVRRIFDAYVSVGFTQEQAMQLIMAHIYSLGAGNGGTKK